MRMANACVIINPRAGSAQQWDTLRHQLETLGPIDILETKAAGDAGKHAREAVQNHCGLVIAAGGDGTIHEVINGMMPDPGDTALGVLPLGTGNDLRRTLGIPDQPPAAIKTIAERRMIRMDLIRVKFAGEEFYCHNVASGGFTGQMDEVMTDELKSRWGPLAYMRGAIGTLPDLTRYKTRIRYDGSAWQPVTAMNVIVANGRTAGGGVVVASHADPTDGLLDVVIVRTGTAIEFAGVAARLLAGDYIKSDLVTHRTARRVEIESKPGMWFNIDGELKGNEPFVFTIVPQAINVIVGAEFSGA